MIINEYAMDGILIKTFDAMSVEASPVSGSKRNSAISLSASNEQIIKTKAITKQNTVMGTDTKKMVFSLLEFG